MHTRVTRSPALRPAGRQLAGLYAAVIAVAGAAIVGAGAVAHSLSLSDEVERLRSENLALMRSEESLELRLWGLQARLTEYELRTRELAVVAGVELSVDSTLLGLGGEDPEPFPSAVRIAALSERSLRLSAALDDVESRLAGRPSFLPAEGELTSRYGYRIDPLTGKRSFHRGIDIGSKPGRAVYASADGVVSLAGSRRALGNAVHLSHGFDLTTRYGHLSRIAVKPGQSVKRGDIVGYVGRTGRATGYHLHFEVLLAGRPVDPLQYLNASGVMLASRP